MTNSTRAVLRLAVGGMIAATALTSMVSSPAFAIADTHGGTTWTSVTMKSGPAPRFDSVGTIAANSGVKILCQTPGVSMTGHKGTSNIWDMVARGVMIPDVNVATGSTGYVVERCSYAGAPARTNPRTTEGAISYEFSQLGSTRWEGRCLILARTAYGWNNSSGWSTAEVGGDWFQNHGTLNTTGIPPRGALVWYHNSTGQGHVTISLGEGLVIGSSVNGKVGVQGYKDHGMYRGWSRPNFPLAG